MMFRLFNIIILSILASCGGILFFHPTATDRERGIASVPEEQFMKSDVKTFSDEIDAKLRSLHSYYVIAQKQLLIFEAILYEKELYKLYQSRPYLSLVAIHAQVEEIEKELLSIYKSTQQSKDLQVIFLERINFFAEISPIARLSLENLKERLESTETAQLDIPLDEIEAEYKRLENSKEFQVYEKNIEHLSHLLEVNIKSESDSFRPSVSKSGNITGEEFPAKVWALTFDNGPTPVTTEAILDKLISKKLKATFFQLNTKVKENLATSLKLRDAGMELASNSHSFQDLSKVGAITLENEITVATMETESKLMIDVAFFRLPFGSGSTVPHIRQMISKNDLIHVSWNVDALDWPPQTSRRIVKRTKALMKKTSNDSGIILFHDSHHRSIKAASEIMDHLNRDGRRNCTLGKIVKNINEGAETVCSKQ